ncbi:MAG: hypothetical protein Phog2KO_34630 [Phototrophicaceae bacterium]
MQKSLTAQQVATARRNNSIVLAVLFAIIALMLAFAFGQNILYIIAFFSLPVVIGKVWEEIRTQYVQQKPEVVRKKK